MSQVPIIEMSFTNASYITLEAGTKLKQQFTVLRDLLCAASIEFRSIIDGMQGNLQHVVLPLTNTTPAVLKFFLDWLYTRRIPKGRHFEVRDGFCYNCDGICGLPLDDAAKHEDSDLNDADLEYAPNRHTGQPGAIELYIFAVKFDIPQLRESIIDQEWAGVYRVGDLFMYQDMIKVIKELTSISLLRRLVTDAFATFYSAEDHLRCEVDRALIQKLPPHLLSQGFSLMAANRDEPSFLKKLRAQCVYHEHENTDMAREACKAKHEALHKRKREVVKREQLICGAFTSAS